MTAPGTGNLPVCPTAAATTILTRCRRRGRLNIRYAISLVTVTNQRRHNLTMRCAHAGRFGTMTTARLSPVPRLRDDSRDRRTGPPRARGGRRSFGLLCLRPPSQGVRNPRPVPQEHSPVVAAGHEQRPPLRERGEAGVRDACAWRSEHQTELATLQGSGDCFAALSPRPVGHRTCLRATTHRLCAPRDPARAPRRALVRRRRPFRPLPKSRPAPSLCCRAPQAARCRRLVRKQVGLVGERRIILLLPRKLLRRGKGHSMRDSQEAHRQQLLRRGRPRRRRLAPRQPAERVTVPCGVSGC